VDAVHLEWRRGPGAAACIEGAELARRVEATLGRPVRASDEPGPVNLQGEVKPLGSGWIAVVDVRGTGPSPLRREVALDAPDCRQLDEALTLVVALMADAAIPSPPPLNVPRPAEASSSSFSMALGLDLAVEAGMLPGFAPGFGLSADAAFTAAWHLAVWVHGWPVARTLEGSVGGEAAAWTFGLGPCLGTSNERAVSWFGCVGASGGVIYASGIGLVGGTPAERPYLQAELRGGMRVHVAGPLYARLEIGLAVPVARDSYVFKDGDGGVHEVFHTASVIPLGRLGIEIRTP
jgi:hypothetical protein